MLARYVLSSCVCLSHASIASKLLNVESRKQRHGHFVMPNIYAKIPTGRQKEMGSVQKAIFDHYLAVSQKRCKIGTWLLGYGTLGLIGTRMRSIDCCYFQWPWMAPTTSNHSVLPFCIAFHIFIVSGDRDFKFSRYAGAAEPRGPGGQLTPTFLGAGPHFLWGSVCAWMLLTTRLSC